MIEPVVTSQRRYDFAADFIRRKAKELRPGVVFDVGAGAAPMREPVEKAGLSYHAFDLYPGREVTRWDLSDPCPLQGTDAGLVLMMDVIEHLLNAGLALDHISSVVPEGGYLLISTPNPRWSKSRLHALATGFPSCFTQADLDRNRHVYPVWPHILLRLLEERGYRVEEYCLIRGKTLWPSLNPLHRYPLRLAHVLLCKAIERMDITAASMDYAFVAKKSG